MTPTSNGAGGDQDDGRLQQPSLPPSSPTVRAGIILIMILAASLRIAHLAWVNGSVIIEPRGFLDEAFYHQFGLMVAGGDLLAGQKPFFLSPSYLYFLGLVYALFGPGTIAPFLIQSGLGVLAVFLVYRCGTMIGGSAAGLSGAALLAFDGLAVMYGCSLLPASLDVFLCALFCYWLVRALGSERRRPWLIAGAVSGFFALNRPNTLVWVPLLCAVALYKGGPRRRKLALLALAGACAVIAPSALRNLAVSGEVVLITSHGGLNFYIGNCRDASGTYLSPPWLTPDVRGQADGVIGYLEEDLGRPVRAGEVSGILYRRALTEMASDPGNWVVLMLKKTFYLLNGDEAGLNMSLAYMRQEVSPVLWLLPVGMWILIPAGMAGAALAGREGRVLALFGVVYAGTVVMFFISDRYRLPLHVPLCVLSGAGIAGAARVVRSGAGRKLVFPGVLFCLFFSLALVDVGVPTGAGQARLVHALRLVEDGRIEEARDLASRMPVGAMNPFVWRLKLARAFSAAGADDAASEQLEALVGLAPAEASLHCELGRAYYFGGRTEAARRELETGLFLSGKEEFCLDLQRRLNYGADAD